MKGPLGLSRVTDSYTKKIGNCKIPLDCHVKVKVLYSPLGSVQVLYKHVRGEEVLKEMLILLMWLGG